MVQTLADMPDIWPHLEAHYRAYLQCRSTQPGSFGIERISLQSIESWCNLNGIGADERGEFVIVLMALDDVVIEHHRKSKKTKKDTKSKAGKS